MRYLHGVPMERICENLRVGSGSLERIFQRCAGLFEDVPKKLIEEYRRAPAKHADETAWRTNGKMDTSGFLPLVSCAFLNLARTGQLKCLWWCLVKVRYQGS
jgi:hypothetical protein